MPAKTIRKVGEIGSTHNRYLILPKAGCEGYGITKGTRVEVRYNRVLTILPLKEEGP